MIEFVIAHICVYKYICAYLHIYAYMCVYIYICVYIHLCTHLCIYTWNTLQHTATQDNAGGVGCSDVDAHCVSQPISHCNNTLQHAATHCNILQHRTMQGVWVAVTLMPTVLVNLQVTATHAATHCNTRCNTLQHTATQDNAGGVGRSDVDAHSVSQPTND